jgi:hypothetical protein
MTSDPRNTGPARHRPRRWPWTALAVATALVVVAPPAATTYRKLDVHAQADASVYHHPITTLEVSSDGSGSFTVSSGPAGQVRISSTRTWSGAVEPVIRLAWDRHTLKIRVSCGRTGGTSILRLLGSSCGIHVQVQVPPGVAARRGAGGGIRARELPAISPDHVTHRRQ